MQIPIKELLERSARRHKHLCPRQVLGVRMGMLAEKLLHLDLPQRDKHLLVIAESDGCFIDGLEVATGCRAGRRTLRIEDYGKIAASFVDTRTEYSLRVSVRPEVRQLADLFAAGEKSRWERQLAGYQIMPDESIFSVMLIALNTSLKMILSRPGVRVACDSCGEEVINEREIVTNGALLCRACAGGGYYSLVGNIDLACFPCQLEATQNALL